MDRNGRAAPLRVVFSSFRPPSSRASKPHKKQTLSHVSQIQLRKEAWKKFRTSTGFEPVTSRLPVRCSTNWAMKPLTLGAGQLWVQMFPWKKWVLMIYEINHIWTAEMKWKWRNDRRSERNLCNFVKKPDIVSICFNIVPTLLLLKIVVANRFWYLNITLNRFTQVVIYKSAFRLIYHPIDFTFCFT